MTNSVGSTMRVIIDPTSLGPWSAFKSIPGGGVSAMAPAYEILLLSMHDVATSYLAHRILNWIHDVERSANHKEQQ